MNTRSPLQRGRRPPAPPRFQRRIIRAPHPDGGTFLAIETWEWRHTAVPPYHRRARNRRRTAMAKASRKVNR